MLKSVKAVKILSDVAFLLLGSVLFAAAFDMFLTPGNVCIGGAGGIATILYSKFGLPTGTMIFAINLPLMVAFMICYGYRAVVKTVIGVTVSSAMVDIFALLQIFPQAIANPEENKLLCALFGGITIGAAIGIMFTRGYTTGGTDIVAFLLKIKFKHLPTSKLIMITDGIIIVVAAIALKDIQIVFYSLVSIFMSTSTITIVTGGFDKGRLVYVFSDKYALIADKVATTLARGVTLIDGIGWYTKRPCRIVMCVVKRNEVYAIKTIAKSIDPSAFIITSEATETIGIGFKQSVEDIDAMQAKKFDK